MSALGQNPTQRPSNSMSALPPKADIVQQDRDVRFVPKADILHCGGGWRYSITSSARRFANSRRASALRGWLENAAFGLAPLAGRGCYLKVLRTGASHLHLRRGVAIPRQSCTGRNRVINPQHYDCSDNGHDDAADINTGYAWAT
jgi:hypothetical protein